LQTLTTKAKIEVKHTVQCISHCKKGEIAPLFTVARVSLQR